MKKVIIIGAGPAGLTAAYELVKNCNEYDVTVLEESECFGGISKTVNYKGNRMDMGGHRFFSKVDEVNAWWNEFLPMQGMPAKDDILLKRKIALCPNGADPEKIDEVMLKRHRVSRILFNEHFYDYPVSLKWSTLKNLGLFNTVLVGFSYLFSLVHKLPETNLENFYINRFGKKLYTLFFEYYTQNLWGRHPKEIDASWGAQRVKGLSISAVIKNIFAKLINGKASAKGAKSASNKIETSLIEEFKYPKLGPGELWELCAQKCTSFGAKIITNAKVIALQQDSTEGKVQSVTYSQNGKNFTLDADLVISSMPLKDLILGLNDVPQKISTIAKGLPYRDYMTLGVLVKKLKLKNKTSLKTVGDIVPDCWIYVQDRNVKMGRIQIFNNWSPYMVKDLEHTVWLGLEYFVNEGDDFWRMSESDFASFAIKEMQSLKLIDDENDVIDFHLERVKKAYPAYFDTYSEIDTLREYLNGITNLYCVGRNGQHRYNNLDHSMMTAFEAVKNIKNGTKDKSNIWAVNTEEEYHEEKK